MDMDGTSDPLAIISRYINSWTNFPNKYYWKYHDSPCLPSGELETYSSNTCQARLAMNLCNGFATSYCPDLMSNLGTGHRVHPDPVSQWTIRRLAEPRHVTQPTWQTAREGNWASSKPCGLLSLLLSLCNNFGFMANILPGLRLSCHCGKFLDWNRFTHD